jgi:hypothetical protein
MDLVTAIGMKLSSELLNLSSKLGSDQIKRFISCHWVKIYTEFIIFIFLKNGS